jgi:citrate synthase
MEGFHHDAHPMGMLVSAIAALSTFYPEAKDIDDPDIRMKQIVRLIAKMPTLAAGAHRFSVGHALRLPRQHPRLPGQLPVDDVEDRRAPLRSRPVLSRRSTCCSSSTPTTSRTAPPPPCARGQQPRRPLLGHRRGRCRPLRAPPRRRQRGGHPHAPGDRLLRERRRLRRASRPATPLQGFGHRVYKSYDPRATIIKRTADEVFEVTGKNPLLDIALKLEEVALSDDYFVSRKLYPNVDFYSGLIYQSMGFPLTMFTVLFAIPRTAGWLAHWLELLEQNSRIARPRQLYVGVDEREYVPRRAASEPPSPASSSSSGPQAVKWASRPNERRVTLAAQLTCGRLPAIASDGRPARQATGSVVPIGREQDVVHVVGADDVVEVVELVALARRSRRGGASDRRTVPGTTPPNRSPRSHHPLEQDVDSRARRRRRGGAARPPPSEEPALQERGGSIAADQLGV